MAAISNDDILTKLHLLLAHNGLLYRSSKCFLKLKPITIFFFFPLQHPLQASPLISCQMRLMNNLIISSSPSILLKMHFQEKQPQLRSYVCQSFTKSCHFSTMIQWLLRKKPFAMFLCTASNQHSTDLLALSFNFCKATL